MLLSEQQWSLLVNCRALTSYIISLYNDTVLVVFRVLSQVSCEVQQPRAARPNEGNLIINLELSPMASPSFEPGR